MCKILIAVKSNDSQNVKFERIIKAQERSLSNQPHGISALIVDRENNISVKRELVNYGNVFMWVYRNLRSAKIVAIHTRQSTGGTIDENNIHFFNVGNYYFAHNGIVGKYSRLANYAGYGFKQNTIFDPRNKSFKVFDSEMEMVENDIVSENPIEVESVLEAEEKIIAKEKKQEMCDSYKFLLNIPKPITKSILATEIDKTNFYGKGVIFDKNQKRMIVFSTMEMKVHTDFKNYMILYSYDPENTLLNFKNVLGFKIFTNEKEEKQKAYNMPSGIVELAFKDINKGCKEN